MVDLTMPIVELNKENLNKAIYNIQDNFDELYGYTSTIDSRINDNVVTVSNRIYDLENKVETIDDTLSSLVENLKNACSQFGVSAEAAGRALAEMGVHLGVAFMDCTGNVRIEEAMKELDKILKDNNEDDDNPFELEEQYRWEWLDDFDE